MVTKTMKMEESLVSEMELAIKGLNDRAGGKVYDFSNLVRAVLSQYLASEEGREAVARGKRQVAIREAGALYLAETSLREEWLSDEEEQAWQDL
jgi:hypothetical protein